MRTTKAQLAADNAMLRKQVADLTLDLELARAQQVAQTTPSRRVAAATPAWQAERAAQMALAKEMAMRSGRSVKVSA